ncbi:MAG: hypothetical protein NXY57DRAFT_1070359, partial [Lentinula lateritia]
MDDVAAMKWGHDIEELHKEIGGMMTREDGILKWAEEHNCKFGVDKFKLVDFNRRRIPDPHAQGKTMMLSGPGARIGTITVKSEAYARFLGSLMDKQLRWKEQRALTVKRGQDWITQFRRLARVKSGMAAQHIRQLYKAKALPRMLYAADITLVPHTKKRGKTWKDEKGQTILRQLVSIQRQAAIMIRIWEDKNEALKAFEQDSTYYKIFTDGSGYKGYIGASAVLYKGREEASTIRYRLGPEEHHEVYEGECVGMMLALHLLRNEVNPVAVSIWSDSTAAIAASDSAQSGPSHY